MNETVKKAGGASNSALTLAEDDINNKMKCYLMKINCCTDQDRSKK